MRHFLLRMAAVALATAAAAPAAADVRLSLANGQVTLSASNATVPQILAEWARVGHTRIVNGERVTGAPLTIELTNVPEVQALEIVLRAASGYVLAPRPAGSDAVGSAYDRIYVIPTSNAPRAAAVAPAPQLPSTFSPPRFAPGPPQREDGDGGDDPSRRVQVPPPQIVAPNPRQPVNTAAPGVPVGPYSPIAPYSPAGAPPSGNAPVIAPGAMPVGVPVPGMVLPTAATTPGQAPTTASPQR